MSSSSPTPLQTEALLEFLESNPGIGKGRLNSAKERWESKLKWDYITKSLNSMGGASKSAKEWIKYWTNQKFVLKRIVEQRSQSAGRTGDGISAIQQLDPLRKRMIAIIGSDSFATSNPEMETCVPLSITLKSGEPSSGTKPPQSQIMCTSPISTSSNLLSEESVTQTQAISPSVSGVPGHSPPSQVNIRRMPVKSFRATPRHLRIASPRAAPVRHAVTMDTLIAIKEKRVEVQLKSAEALEKLATSIQNLSEAISGAIQVWCHHNRYNNLKK